MLPGATSGLGNKTTWLGLKLLRLYSENETERDMKSGLLDESLVCENRIMVLLQRHLLAKWRHFCHGHSNIIFVSTKCGYNSTKHSRDMPAHSIWANFEDQL